MKPFLKITSGEHQLGIGGFKLLKGMNIVLAKI